MDETDAALLAILATAYAAKMRLSGRPEWLIQAFLRLVRVMRGAFRSRLFTSLGMRLAVQRLGTGIARYVDLQVPSAPANNPAVVVRDFERALQRAIAKARREVVGTALAKRIALIIPAETQLLTARLTRDAAHHLDVRSITRYAQPTACEPCQALAGTYERPYPPEIWWSHPHCACSWEET